MTVRVDGLKELRRDLKAVEDGLQKTLRTANLKAAELVVREALPHVPVKTGRLRRSVKALASQRDARARAGNAQVPYAAAIHWGRRRGGRIEGRPFFWDAVNRVRPQVVAEYQAEVDALLRKAHRG